MTPARSGSPALVVRRSREHRGRWDLVLVATGQVVQAGFFSRDLAAAWLEREYDLETGRPK